jgi:FlaA1/EpsC-like NDP-sugar epimerase
MLTSRFVLSPTDSRRAIAIAYDASVTAAAWVASFLLGYGLTPPPEALWVLWTTLPIVLALHVAAFGGFRLYRGIWRYASVHDFHRIVAAVGVATLGVIAALFMWSRAELTPRSAFIVNPLFVLCFMVGGRIVYRWWKEHRPYAQLRHQGKPVLILGAGDSGFKLVMQLSRSQSWAVVGLLDDDARKIGGDVYGSVVLGRWDQLGSVAASTGAGHAILTVNGTDQPARRRAFELCEQAGIRLLVLPDLDALIGGHVRLSSIREFEVEDLLRRSPVRLDDSGLGQMLGHGTVLVTGAGGSIGGELCRQVARFAPRRIVLFDNNELALYTILEQLQALLPGLDVVPCIGDVKDATRLDELFREHQPDIVFHAAAYKHVPLMETGNAWQTVRNNAFGTLQLMRVMGRHRSRKLILISTDKAINPTSVMGASKRLAELLMLAWSGRTPAQLVAVRFGNVLGSTGSVVPKFKEQIANGGPVTVTHPDIRRYFMSVTEASQLVLQAALMGKGGEVFVLDMGEPVRIVDLARDLIRLSGLGEEQVQITFTGLRPGEKLFEELLADSERSLPTPHPKLRVSLADQVPAETWEREVIEWLEGRSPQGDAEVRAALARFIPEYVPHAVDSQSPAANVIPLQVARSA